MTGSAILQPVVVLLAWTMVMWLWMYATRIPAMQKGGLVEPGMAGTTGASLRAKLPDSVSWKADNYNHLHEAPTVFYAVCLVLALSGMGEGKSLIAAWAYVALRIVHSVWQATVNLVMVRFSLFALSSIALIALVAHAARVVFALG